MTLNFHVAAFPFATQDLSSNAAEGLALVFPNLFKLLCISSTLQITSAALDRWHSILRRLKKYLAAILTKEQESAALALVNIHCIMQIGITHVQQ